MGRKQLYKLSGKFEFDPDKDHVGFEYLGDAEHVDVGVVECKVDDDQSCCSVDP